MGHPVRTVATRIEDHGMRDGLLAIGEYFAPSPIQEHVTFTRSMLRQLRGTDHSILKTMRWWGDGFTPKSRALYDFERYGPSAYVSDRDEQFGWTINGPSGELLRDKHRFYAVLEECGYDRYLPQRFGFVTADRIEPPSSDIEQLLRYEDALVLKPRYGAGGADVAVCHLDGNTPEINGTPLTWASFHSALARMQGHMVTEYCEQADYAEYLFPNTPNTIRILTMHPTSDDPFVAAAVHRIGSSTSGGVDNFSRGGLSARIFADGSLGPAVRYHHGSVSWHDTHPDTGATIRGVEIPEWDHMRETVLSVCRELPALRYVGWDLLSTEDGFAILEGNNNTDTDLLQAHQPLLTDHRIRAFYQEHGIGRGSRLKHRLLAWPPGRHAYELPY